MALVLIAFIFYTLRDLMVLITIGYRIVPIAKLYKITIKNHLVDLVDRDWQILREGDRYSNPTKHNHSGIRKILATCGDNHL
jgi:hypothetical protein